MGTKILFLLIVASVFLTPAFADSGILLGTDKSEYSVGDKLTINGQIQEKKMPILALRIYDPNGGILSANNVEILQDNSFSKIVYLDAPFYETPGEYHIKIDYGKIKTSKSFIITGETQQAPEIIIMPEIVEFSAEKTAYYDGEFVTIKGKVSALQEPTVLIGIYDPFGVPRGFYFGDISSNNDFEISFLAVDGVNFNIEGTYSAVARYADSEFETFFDYSNNVDTDESLDELEKSFDELEQEIEDELKSLEDTLKELEEELKELEPVVDATTKQTPTKIIQDIIPVKKKSTPSIVNTNTITPEKESDNNLSVEDIALGIMLNEMKLGCDKSSFVDVVSYYDGMGPALFRLCKYSEAISFFDKDLMNQPDNLEVITNKGAALNKLGLYYEAINNFDTALEINPNYLPAINNKANSLSMMGNFDGALSLYSIVLDKNPSFSTSRINMENTLKNIPIKTLMHDSTNEIKPTPVIALEDMPRTKRISDDNKEPATFFEQISQVFSSIGSIFGFMA